jgi:hypothetical protein
MERADRNQGRQDRCAVGEQLSLRLFAVPTQQNRHGQVHRIGIVILPIVFAQGLAIPAVDDVNPVRLLEAKEDPKVKMRRTIQAGRVMIALTGMGRAHPRQEEQRHQKLDQQTP